MAKVDKSALHDFVNGEYVTEQMLDQNFEVLRVAVNDTDARVDEVYTKAEVDLLINNAVGTATVLAGTVFPDPPQIDGAMFYRTDLQMLFVYDNGYSGSYGSWREVNVPPPASAVQLGGVKIGSNISVQGDGTISVPQASGGTLGVVRVGSTLNQDVNGTINVKMGKNSGLDADKVWDMAGKYILGGSLVNALLFSGSLGDFSTSSSSQILSTPVAFYRNLTINNGHTLVASGKGFPQIIAVSERLTLNGTISASGRGSAGGTSPNANGTGKGGDGGGFLIVIANEIVGNGKIAANGDNGANGNLSGLPSGSVIGGSDGFNGKLFGLTAGFGYGGYVGSNANKGGTSDLLIQAAVEYFLVGLHAFLTADYTFIGGAGGGSAGFKTSTGSNASYGGGGGGAGAYGNGGRGGSKGTNAISAVHAHGGGGGGGGVVVVISPKAIPAITFEAKGGNGGNGVNSVGSEAAGGGGGGGGLVYTIAPSSSATIDVTGGSPGTGTGDPGFTATAGQTGFSKLITLS